MKHHKGIPLCPEITDKNIERGYLYGLHDQNKTAYQKIQILYGCIRRFAEHSQGQYIRLSWSQWSGEIYYDENALRADRPHKRQLYNRWEAVSQ